MAGIADFRLPITHGHCKELPHRFFNRQSAISNRQSWPVLVAAKGRAVVQGATSSGTITDEPLGLKN
jgi:hypothetical protein